MPAPTMPVQTTGKTAHVVAILTIVQRVLSTLDIPTTHPKLAAALHDAETAAEVAAAILLEI